MLVTFDFKASLYNLPHQEPETEWCLRKLSYLLGYFQYQAFLPINDHWYKEFYFSFFILISIDENMCTSTSLHKSWCKLSSKFIQWHCTRADLIDRWECTLSAHSIWSATTTNDEEYENAEEIHFEVYDLKQKPCLYILRYR